MRQYLQRIFKGNYKQPVKDIQVCGWEGSGSTYLYQLCHHIGLTVDKNHGLINAEHYRINLFTIRDPRDIILSNARRVSKEVWDSSGKEEAVLKEFKRFVTDKNIETYENALVSNNTLIVRYELMIKGVDQAVLVQFLCDQFGIVLAEEKILQIINDTSLDSNRKRAEELKNFSTWDRQSLIHGNHITNSGKIGGWREEFSEDIKALVSKELGSFIEKIGY